MITITVEQLQTIMPNSGGRAHRFVGDINITCEEFEIDTELRAAMFLAQTAEESGELRYTRELWGPTAQQMKYERSFADEWTRDNPANRLAFTLGNSEAGDGLRFLGRGLIQITGRANYATMSERLFGDRNVLLNEPERLERPNAAARSAGAFWAHRALNQYADSKDLIACTRRVNGGLTHYDRRSDFYQRALQVLGA